MSESISTTEAQGFSREDKAGFYTLKERPTDQLSELLRFRAVRGHETVYPTVDASDLASDAAVVSSIGQTVADDLPTFGSNVGRMSHIASNLVVNSHVPGRYGNAANIVRELINLRVAAVVDKWRTLLINGDSGVPGEFDGLVTLADNSGKTHDATGGDPIAGEVEKVVAMLDPQGAQDGRFLVMNQKALHTLWAGNYKNQIAWGTVPGVGPAPMISGTPVLIDNFIPDDIPSAGKTPVLAVLLRGAARIEAIFPAGNAGREVQVRGPTYSESTDELRFTVTATLGLVEVGTAVAMLKSVNAP